MNDSSRTLLRSSSAGNYATVLLVLGALLGAALAASGLFERVAPPSNEAVIAEVNGWAIQNSDFERFVSSLEQGKSNALSVAGRQNLLDRMIEEKLLLQRGLELGLAESDASVRKAISGAMIQTITAEVSAIEPDAADLAIFYRNNASYFARSARLRVQQLVFLKHSHSKQAYERASQAYAALSQGADLAQVIEQFADKPILAIPNVLLPPHKLRDYIGPKLTELALNIQAGRASAPQEQADAYKLVYVLENEPQATIPLSQIRERVISEYQRRAGEQALRDYLKLLRAEADVRVSPAFDFVDGLPQKTGVDHQ